MIDDNPICDWCGANMHKICDHGSGMGATYYDLWLCNAHECGHERELMKPASVYVPEQTDHNLLQ